jgi:hypothetical protein
MLVFECIVAVLQILAELTTWAERQNALNKAEKDAILNAVKQFERDIETAAAARVAADNGSLRDQFDRDAVGTNLPSPPSGNAG